MNHLSWMREKWTAWDVGGADWGIRVQAQFRWWARRWGFAVAACLLAWALGVWWHSPIWLARAQLKSEVEALQSQLMAAPIARPQIAGPVASDEIHRLPTTDQQERLWTHLQNKLAQHGVRLMGVQPVNDLVLAPLSSQAMSFRLQARFENWTGVWASLLSMGPIWSMDRLRVVPGANKEGVDIEVVWRLWFKPGASADTEHGVFFAVESSDRPKALLQKEAVSIFDLPIQMAPKLNQEARAGVLPLTGVVVGVPSESAVVTDPLSKPLIFSNEPERLPMLPMRLIGIWRQGAQAEAVVANATHWFRIQEGRQLSIEGHRVWRIGRDDMEVRDAVGRIQSIAMEVRAP
ncbi:hypothetical protein [Limnohabitans sp. Rim8]|uniref:hypothetical protein n=1 Tax=Limnohabitans sp. Rim8 TaxID=1100718 RepID=UPI0026249567|nr:hypothetical protein [Limnohabitans sp. Rim8]